MEIIFENLAQYGVLGLWTIYLIWSNNQMKKEFQTRFDRLNDQMLETVKENNEMLEQGLREMRQRYTEERMHEQWERENR